MPLVTIANQDSVSTLCEIIQFRIFARWPRLSVGPCVSTIKVSWGWHCVGNELVCRWPFWLAFPAETVFQAWTSTNAAQSSDINKDWTCKDKDKDKDQAYKDLDKDKD